MDKKFNILGKLSWALVILLTTAISLGCKEKEILTIGGSETLHGTAEYLSLAFEKENSSLKVEVIGGGSQVGIDLLKQGKLDMALSSRDLTEEEFAALNKDSNLEKLTIAYDGIAIVTNPKNPRSQITTQEISDIFSGKISNWKELGGEDSPIQVIVRNDKSGTLSFFTSYALKGRILGPNDSSRLEGREFSKDAIAVADNVEMANAIQKYPNAIGFMGMGSALIENQGKVKTLSFSKTGKDPYIEPTPKNVLDRRYKLARGLYMIYRADTKQKIDAFTSFVTGDKGQELILKRGYLRASLPEVEVKAE